MFGIERLLERLAQECGDAAVDAVFWLLFVVFCLAIAWQAVIRWNSMFGNDKHRQRACWLLQPFWRRRAPPEIIVIEPPQHQRDIARHGSDEQHVVERDGVSWQSGQSRPSASATASTSKSGSSESRVDTTV